MIGRSASNNDLIFLLNSQDIANIAQGPINGVFFTDLDSQHPLEARVEQLPADLLKAGFRKENDVICGAYFIIRPSILDQIKQRGTYSLHEGFRHVDFYDVDAKDFREHNLLLSFEYEGLSRRVI